MLIIRNKKRRTQASRSNAKTIIQKRKIRGFKMKKKESQKGWMHNDESINIHTLNLSNYNKINVTNNIVKQQIQDKISHTFIYMHYIS